MELSEKTRIASLAKKAARGNVNAYGALITYYQDYLYRVAFLYVKNEDLALTPSVSVFWRLSAQSEPCRIRNISRPGSPGS